MNPRVVGRLVSRFQLAALPICRTSTRSLRYVYRVHFRWADVQVQLQYDTYHSQYVPSLLEAKRQTQTTLTDGWWNYSKQRERERQKRNACMGYHCLGFPIEVHRLRRWPCQYFEVLSRFKNPNRPQSGVDPPPRLSSRILYLKHSLSLLLSHLRLSTPAKPLHTNIIISSTYSRH